VRKNEKAGSPEPAFVSVQKSPVGSSSDVAQSSKSSILQDNGIVSDALATIKHFFFFSKRLRPGIFFPTISRESARKHFSDA
jgi:hypothetical protein